MPSPLVVAIVSCALTVPTVAAAQVIAVPRSAPQAASQPTLPSGGPVDPVVTAPTVTTGSAVVDEVDASVTVDVTDIVFAPTSTVPPTTRPTDTRPTDTRPTDTRPTDTRPTDTRPTDTRPTDTRPTTTTTSPDRPTDTRPDPAPDEYRIRFACAPHRADEGAVIGCKWSEAPSGRVAGYRLLRAVDDHGRESIFETKDLSHNGYRDHVRLGHRYSYAVQFLDAEGHVLATSHAEHIRLPAPSDKSDRRSDERPDAAGN